MAERELTVILVDHEPRSCNELATSLRNQYGFRVDIASDVEEARALLSVSGSIYQAAVINDILPSYAEAPLRESGIELMNSVRPFCPQTHFILFSDVVHSRGLNALRAGAFRYLSKPVDVDELGILISYLGEYHQPSRIAREKGMLERLMKVSAALHSDLSQEELLRNILLGVKEVGFDRVRLYLISDDEQSLVGQAHIGMDDTFIGYTLRLSDYTYMRDLINDPRPHLFKRKNENGGIFEKRVVEENLEEWVTVPLIIRGKIIGKITADNKFSRRPIDEKELTPLTYFASLAAAAIENARLLSEAKINTRTLSKALRVSSADLSRVLAETCKVAVELLDVDHSGLVIFDEDMKTGEVYAEHPEIGAKGGARIQIEGIPAEENLLEYKQPLLVPNVEKAENLGTVRDLLLKRDIWSTLIVPVVSKERIIGSFSFETIKRFHDFTPAEADLALSFARRVAAAIENAQLFENNSKWTERALQSTSQAITSQLDRNSLLFLIVQHALKLLNAKSGGIYEYFPGRGELEVIFDYKRPEHRGTILKVGEGVAGRLIESEKEFWIVKDYNKAPERANVYDANRPFGAVLEVPLKWQSNTIGILYIEDELGREFTEEDAQLLRLFADQAAMVFMTTELLTKQRDTQRRLDLFFRASNVVGSAKSLTEALATLAEMTVSHLSATFCNVMTVDENRESLVLKAMYSVEGVIPVTKLSLEQHIPISKWPSLVDILDEGKPKLLSFNEGQSSPVLIDCSRCLGLSTNIQSLLLVPLRVGGNLVGLLSLGEVTGDEQRLFTKEKIEIAGVIAAQTAVLIIINRRKLELELLLDAAKAMAAELDIKTTLQTIAIKAKETLKADSAFIWLCPRDQKQLISEELIGIGIDEGSLEELKNTFCAMHAEADLLMKQEISEVNLFSVQEIYSEWPLIKALRRIGVNSFRVATLKAGADRLGLLFVNYHHTHYVEDDQELLESLVTVGSLSLRKTLLLEQIRRLIEARTSLAWMGMTSSLWRHSIEGDVAAIRNLVALLRLDLESLSIGSMSRKKIKGRLSEIDCLIERISERPIAAPLSSAEGVQSVGINDLIYKRLVELKDRYSEKGIKVQAKLHTPDKASVNISPEWLIRAFDILMDNAAEALEGSQSKVITVETQVENDYLRIAITDTGRGIPPEIKSNLFTRRIEKSERNKGLGIGLLMAHAIFQTYGGNVYLESTGSEGTIMVITLPLGNSQGDIKGNENDLSLLELWRKRARSKRFKQQIQK